MKTTKILTFGLMLLFTLNFVSCTKKGCTDPSATNYDADAKKNDGSCVYPTPLPPININSSLQYTFDLDGVNYTGPSVSTVQNYYSLSGGPYISETQSAKKYGSYFYDVINQYVIIGITKAYLIYDSENLIVSKEEFIDYFDEGTYPLYTPSSNNGIIIGLGDGLGNYYTSDIGEQTGSSFKIVSSRVESIDEQSEIVEMKFYAEFNCKVYNSSNPSDYKTITNGKFVGIFVSS